MSPGAIGRWSAAPTGTPPITFLQQVSSTSVSSPASLTLGNPIGSASLLLVIFSGFNGLGTPAVMGITDTHNTWAADKKQDVASTGSSEIWSIASHAIAAVAGSYAVSVAFSGAGGTQQITLAEFNMGAGAFDGIDSLVDVTGSASRAATTSPTSPALTPSVGTGDLFVMGIALNTVSATPSISSTSIGNGWVALGTSGVAHSGMGAYLIAPQGNASIRQCTFTLTASTASEVAGVAYTNIL